MNCEKCDIKFERLKDVIQHSTSKKHSCTSFLCISCVLPLPSVVDVVQHISSKEHYITALATGVRFDTTNYVRAMFPPHNCCLLCGSRDNTPDNDHLKSDYHRRVTWLLRTMITNKKIYSNRKASPITEVFRSKMINAKRNTRLDDARGSMGSLRFTCELCNLHYVHLGYLNQHLADESHKRMEEFMIQISRTAHELAIIGAGSNTCVSKAFSNSLRALYYCEVCNVFIDTRFNYIQHRKSPRHKRVESSWKKHNKWRRGGSGVLADVFHCYPKLELERFGKPSVREEPKAIKHASKKLKTSPSNPQQHNSEDTKHYEEVSKLVEKELKKIRYSTCGTMRETSSPDFEVKDSKRNFQKPASPRRSSLVRCDSGKETKLDLENGESTSNSLRHDFEEVQDDADIDKEHYCELCDFLCYNSLHYEKHLVCAQHKRMMRLINRKAKVSMDIQECRTTHSDSHPLQYNCELCDVSNQDSQSYEFHLNSPMHRKNKWMLYVLKQRPI